MSSDNYENVIIRAETDGEGLVKDWEKIMGEFLADMHKIESLPDNPGQPFEKFMEMVSIKQRYNLRGIPSAVTRGILSPELDKLKDVLIEDITDGIRIRADFIEVNVMTGHDVRLDCQNKEEYRFFRETTRPISPAKLILLNQYKEYKAGSIGRIGFARCTNKGLMDLRKSRKTLYHRGILFIEGLFHITFRKDEFESLIEWEEQNTSIIEKRREIDEYNRKRDEKMEVVLSHTGLSEFIRGFRQCGLEVRSKGLIEDFQEIQ